MKDIAIAGGGVAGLTLGIALRQQGVPVTLFEAGSYPRHRVCGEFISGQGQQSLERLRLLPALRKAGALDVKTVGFYSARRCYMQRTLPTPGIAISRWSLDAVLAEEFSRLGGDLRIETRWQDDYTAPGVVRATGRQRAAPGSQPCRWFGLKSHASQVRMESDLEMHFLKNGYIGLCRLDDGSVNVCGLFATASNGSHPKDLLRGPAGSLIHERLKEADWAPAAFCAVAGLPLHAGIYEGSEACIGDAIAMVPPVTGNGLSFALESAELATGPLARFARDNKEWATTMDQLRADHKSRFGRRLFWANKLHQIVLRSGSLALWLGCANSTAWRLCFSATR